MATTQTTTPNKLNLPNADLRCASFYLSSIIINSVLHVLMTPIRRHKESLNKLLREVAQAHYDLGKQHGHDYGHKQGFQEGIIVGAKIGAERVIEAINQHNQKQQPPNTSRWSDN